MDEFDPLAPDSDLDPPVGVPETFYVISSGLTVGILPNDWVDIGEEHISPDSNWGYSFQVIECLETYITIKVKNSGSGLYEEIALSPICIDNNFRRVPQA